VTPQVWDVRVFQRHPADDPTETCPVEDFFRHCPQSVREDLFATVDAVASAPPPQFTGGGMWEAMHGSMRGYYEARTRGPDRRLYRLFCLLEREAPGLDRPAIVLIAGLSTPVGTALSEPDYSRVRRLGDEYRRRTPRRAM
jgi:hypothetical protein